MQIENPDAARQEKDSQSEHLPKETTAENLWLGHLKRARALASEGQTREARDALQQAVEAGAELERFEPLALRLALAEQDWQAATVHAQNLLDRGTVFTGHIAHDVYKAYCALGLWTEAYTFLSEASVLAEGRRKLIRPLYTSLLSCTSPEKVPEIIENLMFGENGGPEHTSVFKIWAMQIGAYNEPITALMQRARDTWPDDPIVADNLSDRLSVLPEHEGPEDQDDIAYLRLFVRTLKQENPDDPRAHVSEKIVESDIVRGLQRPLLIDDLSDFVVSPEGTSGTSVLVFGGIGGGAFINYPILDSSFAARNVTGLYVRDSSRLLTLNGIPTLGASLDQTIEALQSRLNALSHHKRLVVFGTSGGGLGALQYGARLNADAIHLISPAINVNADFLRRIGDARAPVVQARLGEKIRGSEQDGREALSRAPSTRTYVHYTADNPTDRAHAEHLKGLPNVQLRPRHGESAHNILQKMVENDTYQALIDEICATDEPANP
ncbi:hypothetical protein [Pseudophaeobacter sp.]|uniref:hypothetical protein n=1 Tax=Pseudophaeobacter sp. TaxID=1971739 RepID=UPI003299B793